MTPGRFVTVWMLSLGVLMVIQFLVGVLIGEVEIGLTVSALGIILPAIGVIAVGFSRLRNPKQEMRPADYGIWLYPAVSFLLLFVVWMVYHLAIVLL